MKMRDLFIVTLAILLTAGVSLSQQSTGASLPPTGTPSASGSSSSPPQDDVVTKIVSLRYYPAEELRDLLIDLIRGQGIIVADQRSNQLIITGERKRLDELLEVIGRLDVVDLTAQQGRYLTCRVYMLELPSKEQNLKPFSVLLERPSQWPTEQVMNAARDASVQISTLLQRMEDDKWELIIEGRAASNDALTQMLAKRTDNHIKQLKWDDENFTATVPAAQASRLPAPLQEHIRKFLGDEVQTVGYWFGNLSVPGNLNAPIGPWSLDMKTQSEQGNDLVLEVRVTRESPIPFVDETQLLSNTIQGKAGRPILIGYNRESYGTRVMGAMVILLESDTTAPTTTETKTQ